MNEVVARTIGHVVTKRIASEEEHADEPAIMLGGAERQE